LGSGRIQVVDIATEVSRQAMTVSKQNLAWVIIFESVYLVLFYRNPIVNMVTSKQLSPKRKV